MRLLEVYKKAAEKLKRMAYEKTDEYKKDVRKKKIKTIFKKKSDV